MSEYKLEFLNPVFKSGLNYTVRLGDKWFERLCPGDFVEIADVGAVARIISVESVDYNDLVDCEDMLVNEHDPACRDWDGLDEAMRRAYPDDSPLSTYGVTIIGFWVYKLIG